MDMRKGNKEGLPEGGMEIRKGIGMQITASVLSQHPYFVLVFERGRMEPAKESAWALKSDFPGKELNPDTYLLSECEHTHWLYSNLDQEKFWTMNS